MINPDTVSNVLWQFTVEAYRTTSQKHDNTMDAYDEAMDIAHTMTERFIRLVDDLQDVSCQEGVSCTTDDVEVKENPDALTRSEPPPFEGSRTLAEPTGYNTGLTGQGSP